MLTLAFIIELVFVIGFPLALGVWIHRRWRVSWLLFAAGAITFGLSQAVHLPMNMGVFALLGTPNPLPGWANAILLGLTAGLCEETARYLVFRWILRDQRESREALMFGAGHGGIESIVFVGLAVGAAFVNMSVLQGANLENWALPGGQLVQLQAQFDAYWGQVWYMPLLGAAERLFSITFHMGMAVLVLQAVVRRRPAFWLLAVGLHTATNAVAVTTGQAGWHPAATEGAIGLFALLALAIIRLFWNREEDGGDQEGEGSDVGADPAPPRLLLTGPRRRTAEERLRERIEESKWE